MSGMLGDGSVRCVHRGPTRGWFHVKTGRLQAITGVVPFCKLQASGVKRGR